MDRAMLRQRRKRLTVKDEDLQKLEILLGLLNDRSQPNLNALTEIVRNLPLLTMNVKAFGYDLAHRLAAELPARGSTTAQHVGLQCKASVQADIESDWVAHWCAQLHSAVVFHRKVWELCYVLQAVHENGLMRDGVHGLGFGCGAEPLASYLAGQGVRVTVTDLPLEEAAAKGWVDGNQHTATLDKAFYGHLVDRASFDRLVDLKQVDMNAIPNGLEGHDFCWSVCALEHLGSIAHGLAFIENSLKTLKPGGLAVHTTEFNINPNGPTVDNWPCVLFQRRHLEDLASRLRVQGHRVAPFDWNFGDKPMDKFVDLPPFSHDLPNTFGHMYGPSLHLKLGLDGFPCTCFGLIIHKAA